jgi:outer membrane protein
MTAKSRLGAALAVAALLSLAGPALAESLKIGAVDVQKVLDNSIVGQQATKKLKELGEKYAADLKSDKAKLDALTNEIDKNSLLWNEQTRKEKDEERRRMERDLSRTAKDYDEDFKARQREYLETISREIQKTVEEIGQGEKFQLIFDVRSREVIYYSPDAVALTDKVIKAYDAKKR